MFLDRRRFLQLFSATVLASTLRPGLAAAAVMEAAPLTLGSRITLPKSPGSGVIDAALKPLGASSFRVAYSPLFSTGYAVGRVLDYSSSTGKPIGKSKVVGKGSRSVSVSPLELPSSRVAIYIESFGLYFQPLSSSGAPSGARVKLASSISEAYQLKSIKLQNGRYLVMWPDSNGNMIGYLLSSTGKKLSRKLSLLAGSGGLAQTITSVCALPGGGFAIAYNPSGQYSIAKFRRFTVAGAADGPWRLVDSRAQFGMEGAHLYPMPNGDLLVFYCINLLVQNGGDGKASIRARLFTKSGSSTEFFVHSMPDYSVGTNLVPPKVVKLKGGDLLVVFTMLDSFKATIFALRLGANGTVKPPAMTIFQTALTSGLSDYFARVNDLVALSGGKAVVSWTDGLRDSAKTYLRMISPA